MSSIRQVSPRKSNDPSGLQKATTPKLQITSDDEEANIRAKMAERKRHKAAREEAAQLEAERLEREQLEAEQRERERVEAEWRERERLEAKRKEQERLKAKRQEQEAWLGKLHSLHRAQQKAGEPKGKAWDKGTSAAGTGLCKQCEKGRVSCTFSRTQQSKRKKRTCNRCTEMKVRCELPEGVELEVEETGAKSGKKQALEDTTSPRAGEKRKVIRAGSGVPGESEAGPLGVVASTTASSDPLVVVVTKGFELIAAVIDRQTVEMRARRETQCRFNSWLGDLLGEFEFILRPTPPASKSSEELHSDVAALELESLQSDHKGVGVELDERIMRRPEDVHMKGRWSGSESGEDKELQTSEGEVFEGDSK
ncbi:hypothetical protein M404DRAFT_29220 [Pisolithus tinctorius Marx 270]|uniref:Uncharacterized protein n=1 Tax=Pisolithus tinctorius Marx 270 TaxID=870435 RepID=A0A0C3NIK1_PISTI|nr:hypothetical protein M404DRAFT_29220 [Pisolithus tinctorius Marx 270]